LKPEGFQKGYTRRVCRKEGDLPAEGNDAGSNWRVIYRIDADAIVILEVFAKKSGATPKAVIATCRKRLKEYDSAGK
jgi:phage-related protein